MELNKSINSDIARLIPQQKFKLSLSRIEEYNFIFKTGGSKSVLSTSHTEIQAVDQNTIEQVRNYLIKKYPNLLRNALGSKTAKNELKKIINEYLSKAEHLQIKGMSLDELSTSLLNAIAGLGVIDAILEEQKNEDITDIRFNGNDLWIYSNTKLPYKSHRKISRKEAADLAMKIAFATNKEFSSTVVELDAEISNLRVNAVHESVSAGTCLAFRVMTKGVRITEDNFVKTLGSQVMLDFLIACVKSKISIAVTGETGTGKTELIKFLMKFTLNHHPINVIEDTPETYAQELYPEKDICNWFTKKSSSGAVEVDITRLLRSALRNNPSWLIITESRGGEMIDILKAAGTGHAVMTSFHTDSTQSSSNRIVLMAKESSSLDEELIQTLIPDAFRIVAHIEYDTVSQKRRIAGLGEYVGMDIKNNTVNTEDLFGYTVDGASFVEKDGLIVLETKRSFKQLSVMSDKLAEHFIASGVLTPNLIPLLSDNIKNKYKIPYPQELVEDNALQVKESDPIQNESESFFPFEQQIS
ncbi:ATPase, T2SS/T4P/T4SS family [Lysinibacillus sphaericus]